VSNGFLASTFGGGKWTSSIDPFLLVAQTPTEMKHPRHETVAACGQNDVPSGKHTNNYEKSQFSMGKSTIDGHFQ